MLKVSAYDELREAVRAVAHGRTYLSPQIAEGVGEARRARAGASRPLLGPREREVLQLIAEGHSSPEISRRQPSGSPLPGMGRPRPR